MAAGTPPPVPLRMARTGGRESRAAAETWLCQAADDVSMARNEWDEKGFALLRAGVIWDAVRLPFTVLGPGLDRGAKPGQLRQLLVRLALRGPVVCDPYRPYLYVLVPPGTDRDWEKAPPIPGVECLGGTPPFIRILGVPRIDRLEPPGQYWLTPPDPAGRLADPIHLYRVLRSHAATPSRGEEGK